MKNKFFACFTFVMLYSNLSLLAQNQLTLIGKVKNHKQDTIQVSWNDEFYNTTRHQVVVSKKGDFFLSFPFEDFRMIYVRFAGQQYEFFTKAGDKIEINYDRKNIEKTIQFKLPRQDELSFLKKYGEKFPNHLLAMQMAQFELDSFVRFADSLDKEIQNYFDSELQQKKVSSEFEFMQRNEWIYRKAGTLIMYPMIYSFLRDGKKLENLSDNYYNFLEKLSKNADSLLVVDEYLIFSDRMLQYTNGQINKSLDKPRYDFEFQSKIIELLFSGKLKEYHLAKSVITSLEYGQWAEAEKAYHQFLERYPNNRYKQQVKNVYEKKKKLAPGQMAFNFALKDLNGKVVSLKDFAGKIVYLDVWASWCGPCIKEMPKAKELKQKAKELGLDKDIVFLYVSVDADEKSWRKAIEKYEIDGIHLNCLEDIAKNGGSFSEIEFSTNYGVSGIPHYYLIDREGKFIESNADRPSNPELIEKLKKMAASK